MTRARRWHSAARRWLFGSAALFTLGVGANAYAGGGPLQVVDCTSDADCLAGDECELGPDGTSSRDCAPDAGACDPTPTPEPRTGRCEPKTMTCEVDADCLTGLTCEHHDDSDCASTPTSPGDAGIAPADEDVCGPSEPSPGECVYRFVACKTDSDCDGGLVCTALGTESECSSDAVPCMPGHDCAQPEETCTETTRSYCFPPRVDCEDSDDCEAGTRCVELSEDAQEDPPAAWKGATALCLPEAIALVLEERVEAAGVSGGTSKSSSNSAGESDSADGSDSDGRATAGGGVKSSDDKVRADSDGGANAGAGGGSSSADGCAVSKPGMHNDGAGWMVLLGAAALYARRRRSPLQR